MRVQRNTEYLAAEFILKKPRICQEQMRGFVSNIMQYEVHQEQA